MIIYDSMFGNTEQIARAIGAALGSQGDVGILKVKDVTRDQLKELELLIVGSPTRGFRPTPAITSFCKGTSPASLNGIKVAAFDTRIATQDIKSPVLRFLVNRGGYAARPIAEHLKKRGAELLIPPEGFYVKGAEGPLQDGELERAADWARLITKAGTQQVPRHEI